MDVIKRVEQWKPLMKPVLDSKTSEFKLMEYSNATNEDIWNCLVQKVWKGNPERRLHEIVQDIFHLASHMYMGYLTAGAYQENDLMASIAALSGESNMDA